MKFVVGTYGRDGYEIATARGAVLYSAGANELDSQAPGTASLRKVRSWCIRTGREIAAERGAAWCGAERRKV
jgi:hypothetical protein